MRKLEILDVSIGEEAKQLELSDEIYAGSDQDTTVVLEVQPEAYDLIANFNAEDSVNLAKTTKSSK
jgi:hypothetical protein